MEVAGGGRRWEVMDEETRLCTIPKEGGRDQLDDRPRELSGRGGGGGPESVPSRHGESHRGQGMLIHPGTPPLWDAPGKPVERALSVQRETTSPGSSESG